MILFQCHQTHFLGRKYKISITEAIDQKKKKNSFLQTNIIYKFNINVQFLKSE